MCLGSPSVLTGWSGTGGGLIWCDLVSTDGDQVLLRHDGRGAPAWTDRDAVRFRPRAAWIRVSPSASSPTGDLDACGNVR